MRLATVTPLAEGACARARRLLDSYLDGELTVETNHDLLDHLERCEGCRAEGAAREGLRAAVRRVAVREAAEAAEASGPPAALAERIRAAIRRTRPRRGLAPAALLLAAMIVAAAGLALARRAAPAEARALRIAEVTQVHCALGFEWPPSAPAMGELQEHAGAALGPLLPALAGRLPDWGIVAAHACEEEGVEVLHVILRRPGASGPASLASLVVVPGVSTRGGTRARDGFTFVAESGRSATAFLVTSEGPTEARALSRRAFPVLRPVLA